MIAINGNILENKYTTSQWAAITAILPNRVWGHEVDDAGFPVGSKMGDGVHLWSDLKYWYGSDPSLVSSGMAAAGSPNPIVVPFIYAVKSVIIRVPSSDDDTKLTTRQVQQQWDEQFTDNTYATMESVLIYGNDDGSGNLAEDTYYVISA